MGSGEQMKKYVPKVRFEPCAEAQAVGREIAKEESLRNATFLNTRSCWHIWAAWQCMIASLVAHARSLVEVGLAVLADSSGKLMNQRRACTRTDVIGNPREPRMVPKILLRF